MARVKRYNSETGQWEYCNTGGMPIKGIDYLTKADYDTMRADIDAYLERNKESVGVTVSGNQAEDDVIGATVRVVGEDGTVMEEKTWNGSELVFRLEAGTVYHVEADASGLGFSGYTSETFTAVKGGARTVTAEVYAEKVNVSVEGIDSGFTVTVKEEYTPCEYIESTGAQYIDTGFKANNNTRVVIDFEITTTPSATSTIFGGCDSSSAAMFEFMWHVNGYFRSDYNKTATQQWEVEAVGRRVVDKNKETTTVDGVSNSYTNATFSGSYNLHLFSLNDGGTTLKYPSSNRLYSCQIYDNGTLIRDYIPVMNSSGVYGLYDKVNGVFYSSATSTGFTGKVLDVDGLPSGYVECDYVESDGNQYVDTGVGIAYKMDLDIQFLARSNRSLMGNSTKAGCYFGITTSGYYESGSSVVSSYSGLERRVISIESTSSAMNLTAEGETITRSKTTTPTENLKLFGGDSESGLSEYMCSARLFGCQVYVDDVLVRDYVPCKSDEGVFGLYDKVDGVFYASVTSTGLTGAIKTKTFLVLAETSGSCLVPYNTVYSVSATAVDGYTSPSSQTFKANVDSRNVIMTYEEDLLGVFIEDINGKLWKTDAWDGSVTFNGVAVCTEDCRFVIGASYSSCNWSNTSGLVSGVVSTTDLNVASVDYNGKENTQAIIAARPSETSIAAYLCYSYKFPNGQNGYLGAGGEWTAVCNNYTKVSAAFKILNTTFTDDFVQRYWVSTEYDADEAWECYPDDQIYAAGKQQASTYYRPFTTLKRDTN